MVGIQSIVLVTLTMLLFLDQGSSCQYIKTDLIAHILKHNPLKLRHLDFCNLPRTTMIPLSKHVFKQSQLIGFISSIDQNSTFSNPLMICAESESVLLAISKVAERPDFAIWKPVLVLTTNPAIVKESLRKVRLNQEVYVIDQGLSMTETYSVNGQIVTNSLGRYNSKSAFSKSEIGQKSFHQRRKNFMGKSLLIM